MQGGGTQKNLDYLIKNMVKMKTANVSLLTFNTQDNDAFKFGKEIKRFSLELNKKSESIINAITNNYQRILKLRKFFKENKFDTVVSFLTSTNILTIISTFGLKSKIIICERNDPYRQKIKIYWRVLRFLVFGLCDKIICNSSKASVFYSNRGLKKKVRLIPNFIYLNKRSSKCTKKNFFLAIGRLHSQKGFDLLIDSFSIFLKSISKYDLVILGEGPQRDFLQKKISSLGLNKKVFLPGHLNPHEYFKNCSLYISCSRYEGVSNATLEAMHYKIPIIVTQSQEGMYDYLKDNFSAVFSPNDSSILANKIKLLINDNDLSRKISKNSFAAINLIDNNQIKNMWFSEVL